MRLLLQSLNYLQSRSYAWDGLELANGNEGRNGEDRERLNVRFIDIVSIMIVVSEYRNLYKSRWVQLYQETGDAGYICRRCKASRPTLRKWATRYASSGIDGLKSQNKRSSHSPKSKVVAQKKADFGTATAIPAWGWANSERTQAASQPLFFPSHYSCQKIIQRRRVQPVVRGPSWSLFSINVHILF